MFFVFWRILWIGAIYCKKQISIIFQIIDDKSKWSESSLQVPKKIWRFSSAHFYREVISQINNLWYNILEIIIKGWVVDHRERAESIVSWSGLHLKYNAIFFYAGAGESASCQFLQPRQRGWKHFSLPEYSENSGKCISITLSTHCEAVTLLTRQKK